MRGTVSVTLCCITAFLLSGCAGGPRKPPPVKEVKRYEAQVTAGGILVQPRVVRAWMEDIERDASAATLLKKLEDFQYIGGMAISPKGDVLTFSLVEVVQTKSAEAAKQKAEAEGASAPQTGTLATDGLRVVGNLRSMHAIEGGGITQITTGNWFDSDPAIGPGGMLTFAANRMRPRGMDLFRISLERTGGVSVLRQGGDGYSSAPSLARDGTVTFEFLPVYDGDIRAAESYPQIWVQGGAVPFPTQLREGTEPAISPDGSEIAYIGRDGQLWVMPVTGQTPVQLTTSALPKDPVSGKPMEKRSPSWTPDGTRLVYSAADGKDGQEKPNYDVWMMSKLGGNARQLTTNGSEDRLPVVDPDQKYIYFVSNRGFKEGLWRIPFPI